MSQFVIVVQCDEIEKRCAGFLCVRDFYARKGMFRDYPEDTRYMTLSCGGCPGHRLAQELEHLARRMADAGIRKEDMVLHFASCMVSDNHHHSACPFVKAMFETARKHGFKNIVSGTYISQTSERKRKAGIYRPWIQPEPEKE